MKKVLLMAVALVAAMSVKAQGEMFLKPMVGATLATFTSTDNAKMKFGIAGGAEFGYHLSDPFAVTVGALVSMQGANFDDTNLSKDMKTTLTYLNVPILANYYVAPGLALKAGIQPGFMLSAKSKGSLNSGTGWTDWDTSGTDGYKTFDLAIPLGLSYEISDFVIDARYNLGLTKIADGSDSKNSVIMVTLGYKIPF